MVQSECPIWWQHSKYVIEIGLSGKPWFVLPLGPQHELPFIVVISLHHLDLYKDIGLSGEMKDKEVSK